MPIISAIDKGLPCKFVTLMQLKFYTINTKPNNLYYTSMKV